MRKLIAILAFAFFALEGFSQKNYSIGASANFSFATKGLGTNDAGFGFGVYSNFFTKSRLRLRAEAGFDRFIGSKELVIDSVGPYKYSGLVNMFSARVGPEFFIADNISIAALYGIINYDRFENEISKGNLRMLLNVHVGKRKRTIFGLYHSRSGGTPAVKFSGLSIGFKFI